MELLHSASQFFQNTLGSISLSTTDHRYFIVGFALLIVALLVITQDKPKAITFLIIIYTAWFFANLIPGFVRGYEKAVPSQDRLVLTIVFGIMPIIALLVHKYKRGKKH